MLASDNEFPSLLIVEGTEPAAPSAGQQRLYIDSTTHKLKRTDSGAVDVTIEGGSVATDTIWDAKGDLAVGTGANTAAKLVVGTNGTIAMASSGETTGIKWATLTVSTAAFEVATVILDSTLSGTQASFSVSSLAAAAYDYIEIELRGRSDHSASDSAVISFNSDTTAANYRRASSFGGSSIVNADADDRYIGDMPGTPGDTDSFSSVRIVIPKPSSSKRKSCHSEGQFRQSATVSFVYQFGIEWENTTAIDTITLAPGLGSNFVAGSYCLVKGFKSQTIVTGVSIA